LPEAHLSVSRQASQAKVLQEMEMKEPLEGAMKGCLRVELKETRLMATVTPPDGLTLCLGGKRLVAN